MQDKSNLNNKNIFFIFFILSSLLLLLTAARAENDSSIKIARINSPIYLDGIIDEPAWQGIESVPVTTQIPTYNEPPSERTEILFAYDDDFFYVAGLLYDREPDKIIAPSKKRDYFSTNTDWFGVIIDTFNDKENALAFFTTPSALRLDCTLKNDAQGTSPVNETWNTFWDVAVDNNESGWFVEMRIPFSSLRFQESDGKVVMGLISFRHIARNFEIDIFPAIPNHFGSWSAWKVSRAQEIVFEGIRPKKPVYLTPYLIGGFGHTFDLNPESTAYIKDNNWTGDLGLDTKLVLTSNLALDLTVNTDFAQVEADNTQVNLTRFSLYFPEKRLFFQERASNFDFNFTSRNSLFYSRRIGIHEGQSVPIYGGIRLVGRIGGWDVGFLDMQTAPISELTSENFGVLRIRRQVLNRNSYVGAMLTSRLGTDGSYNTAYGLDGIFRLTQNDYFQFNWAQTFQNGYKNDALSLDPSKFRLAWERRTAKGLGLNLYFSRTGEDYDPGIGFEARDNYSLLGQRILWGWVPGENSPIVYHNAFIDGYAIIRNGDKRIDSAEIGPGWEYTFKSGLYGEVAVKMYKESLLEDFGLSSDVKIPRGEYQFYGIQGYVRTPSARKFGMLIECDAGTFYDGRKVTLGLTPIWIVVPDIRLAGYYQLNWADFPKRKEQLTAHIASVRLTATFSIKFSATAFVQYNSSYQTVIANLRIRYNPREGNDLYIVYNENFNSDRRRADPFLPFSSTRAVLIKYSYTFKFD